MKNAALTTMGIGAMGFMIAASGIDGPTETACVVLAVVSSGIFAVGHRLYQIWKRGEQREKERMEALQSARDYVFSTWSCL